MPDARPWRRGQAPKPHRGAPKAQGLTAAITVAAPSPVPSIAPVMRSTPNSTGADVPMNAFATSRIYTSLTGTTACASKKVAAVLIRHPAMIADNESRAAERDSAGAARPRWAKPDASDRCRHQRHAPRHARGDLAARWCAAGNLASRLQTCASLFAFGSLRLQLEASAAYVFHAPFRSPAVAAAWRAPHSPWNSRIISGLRPAEPLIGPRIHPGPP
jgi:hypothetical protein